MKVMHTFDSWMKEVGKCVLKTVMEEAIPPRRLLCVFYYRRQKWILCHDCSGDFSPKANGHFHFAADTYFITYILSWHLQSIWSCLSGLSEREHENVLSCKIQCVLYWCSYATVVFLSFCLIGIFLNIIPSKTARNQLQDSKVQQAWFLFPLCVEIAS